MRWLVEVSSLGKTDLQKFCVEAESWQRALQAARAQRGEEGPMSGFSIELLEEGYRAVDPLARVRFVVKRAPDDMPVTVTASKDMIKSGGQKSSAGKAPSQGPATAAAPAAAPTDGPTEPKMTPPPSSSQNAVGAPSSSKSKSIPPRPALGVNASAVLGALGVSVGAGGKGGANATAPAANAASATGEQTPEAK